MILYTVDINRFNQMIDSMLPSNFIEMIMVITPIEINKIKLPKHVEGKEYPSDVLKQMSAEIVASGWPIGKELGVKAVEGGFEVHASFGWFKAAELSGIKTIPCVIY